MKYDARHHRNQRHLPSFPYLSAETRHSSSQKAHVNKKPVKQPSLVLTSFSHEEKHQTLAIRLKWMNKEV